MYKTLDTDLRMSFSIQKLAAYSAKTSGNFCYSGWWASSWNQLTFHFLAFENLRHRYFSPLTVISRAPSRLSWFDAVPMRTLFSFSRFSLSIFSLASWRAISAFQVENKFSLSNRWSIKKIRHINKNLTKKISMEHEFLCWKLKKS